MENYKILDGWQTVTVYEAQLDDDGNELIPKHEHKIVFTKVEFYLDKGTVIIEVPHFMPKDDIDIIQGLENRFITENRR